MGLTVITGGGGDFGRAAGLKFGMEGPVLLTNRSVKKLEDNLEIMKSVGMECRAAQLDISERESCFDCAKTAQEYAEELGTEVTAVVNIAGISGNFVPGCPNKAVDHITINALGTVNITDAFYDVLASRGTMVHFASMAAYNLPMFNPNMTEVYKTCGEPDFEKRMMALLRMFKPMLPEDYAAFTPEEQKTAYGAAYCLSKNFVIWYTRANIQKFAKRSMRIISISPGTHLTRHIREMSEETAGNQMSLNPLNCWGSPADMAAALSFLCSENAKYFTGCDILIDGGQTNARFIEQF